MSDTTFNASGVYAATPNLTLTMSVSRGFRAANAFDFGAIGLSGGAGFEISPQRAVELSGVRGSTDGATAISTGQPVGDLDPERLMAYEAGVRWQHRARQHVGHRIRSRVSRRHRAAHADLPGEHRRPGSVGLHRDSAGRDWPRLRARRSAPDRDTRQRVALADPRLRGRDATCGSRRPRARAAGRRWRAAPSSKPTLPRRRMPPVMGGATLTWQPCGGRWWVEGTMLAATNQDRLSDADIGDARIGASRTPASIASFFNGTAVDRGLVRGGVLLATGETLAQVQSRVLGSSTLLPMFTETPGFVVFGVRGGVALARSVDLTVIGENLADTNYRIHGSGVDEPGINLMARLRARFYDVDLQFFGTVRVSPPFHERCVRSAQSAPRRRSCRGSSRHAGIACWSSSTSASRPPIPTCRTRCSATPRSTPRRLELVRPPVIVAGGEAVKNDIAHALSLLKRINDVGLDRQSFVVIVGGGAVLDMASFAAAIAHRGIRVVRMPTTVLAQADSGVGVKNSINLFGKKNFVGTFVPPFAVINDLDFLRHARTARSHRRRRRSGQGGAAQGRARSSTTSPPTARVWSATEPSCSASSSVPPNCTCSTSAATAIRSSSAARGRSTSATGRRTSSSR